MSHGRHDYPMGIHLLRVQGRMGDAIFFPAELLREYSDDARAHAPDLRFWEALVARACDRYAAKVHGYTWLPNEAIFALQRFSVPLRIILPSLLGRYSRYLHATTHLPRGQSPYLGRCESMEVTPELLPYALRNLYARPVRAGLCANPLIYPLCSVGLHLARSVPRWFETREFMAGMRKRGHIGRASVEGFLTKQETQRHAELFERFSSRTPQIAGESADIEDSMQLAEHSPPVPTVEQVTEAVAIILRRESLDRDRVLAAALTTWYATRAGAATLAQMGKLFDREPTTLRANIESRRKTKAALFGLSAADFLRLIRSRTSAPSRAAGSRGSASRVSKAPLDRRAENTLCYEVPVLDNEPMHRRGGPSPPRARPELASTCTISTEDSSCTGTQCELELAVVRPRRTRDRR